MADRPPDGGDNRGTESGREPAANTPRWVWIVGIIVVVLLVLLVLQMLTGGHRPPIQH